MILRGVTIHEYGSVPKEKTIESTIKCRAVLTTEMAEEMNWDCLFDEQNKPTNGWDTLPLTGEIPITDASFKPSDKSAQLKIAAVTMRKFTAHRVAEKGSEGKEFYLAFQITSNDEEFAAAVDAYVRGHLSQKSQLTVNERQMKLTESNGDSETVIDDDGQILMRGEAASEHKARRSRKAGAAQD